MNSEVNGCCQQLPETARREAIAPPSPPATSNNSYQDGKSPEKKQHTDTSSLPETTGRCPIRFLDSRSPEDIAEYFRMHRHEIPRSHEICVKRYQSNEQSIRELDAKYGDLVNMIQGLGAKHRPLLPRTETEQARDGPASNGERIAQWSAELSDEVAMEANAACGHLDNEQCIPLKLEEDRQLHLDHPLRDIRVGESPSRPWGLPVPITSDDSIPSRGSVRSCSRGPAETPRERPSAARPKDHRQTKSKRLAGNDFAVDEKPHMLFTGPVFIGYSPEQAATILKQNDAG